MSCVKILGTKFAGYNLKNVAVIPFEIGSYGRNLHNTVLVNKPLYHC